VEVNRTEPSPSVRVPWTRGQLERDSEVKLPLQQDRKREKNVGNCKNYIIWSARERELEREREREGNLFEDLFEEAIKRRKKERNTER
jgi:hypothetical protein